MLINISVGEALDRFTILKIKVKRIKDPIKLKTIKEEYRELKLKIPKSLLKNKEMNKLLEINKKIWDIENKIRAKENKKVFDKEFIELARSVYINNDKRSNIKRLINTIYLTDLSEEKEYTKYE